MIGVTTAYSIVIMSPVAADPTSTLGKIAAGLKRMTDEGRLGVNAGRGFYDYAG